MTKLLPGEIREILERAGFYSAQIMRQTNEGGTEQITVTKDDVIRYVAALQLKLIKLATKVAKFL